MQIGDNNAPTDRKTPVQSSLTNVVAIAAGSNFSAALNSSGQVFVWGGDNKGQLGDSAPGATNTAVPTQLLSSGGAAIAAGKEFLLIVKTDGTVYGTGENSNSQLGDGSTTDRSALVQMSGISTATKAAAGEKFSIVLLSTGTLKAIGYNGFGQLGDGTNTARTSVVSVATVSNITEIAAGLNHVVARESDGSAWAWGANLAGQVGNDDAPTEASSPVELTSISSISHVGAGAEHSLAVTSTGIVFTWGENASSQLGDGTNVDRAVPTPISDAGFDWKVSTPTFNVAAGTWTTTKTVTISITTSGATIRYTQNGSEPTESDTAYSSPVSVDVSQTLKAKAFKSGMAASNTNAAAYELKVVNVSITPANNTYTVAQSMAMSTTTSGASIYYTVSNDPSVSPSTPTESSTAYSSALSIATYTKATAIAFKSGWTPSDPVTRTLSFNYGTVPTPTADNGAGSYVDSVTVALSSSLSGAVIRYTLNNTAVQSSSTIYTAPLSRDITTTLRFKAFHKDYSTASAEVNNCLIYRNSGRSLT